MLQSVSLRISREGAVCHCSIRCEACNADTWKILKETQKLGMHLTLQLPEERNISCSIKVPDIIKKTCAE